MSARTEQSPLNTYRSGPDERGHFGAYGGRFVAETLMPLVLVWSTPMTEAKNDPAFQAELSGLLDPLCRPPKARSISPSG